jgi:hypothetical protein
VNGTKITQKSALKKAEKNTLIIDVSGVKPIHYISRQKFAKECVSESTLETKSDTASWNASLVKSAMRANLKCTMLITPNHWKSHGYAVNIIMNYIRCRKMLELLFTGVVAFFASLVVVWFFDRLMKY